MCGLSIDFQGALVNKGILNQRKTKIKTKDLIYNKCKLQNKKIKLAYANLFSFSILLTQSMRCELSVNTGPFKNQNGWLKIAALVGIKCMNSPIM